MRVRYKEKPLIKRHSVEIVTGMMAPKVNDTDDLLVMLAIKHGLEVNKHLH